MGHGIEDRDRDLVSNSEVQCVSSLHIPIAIIGWDRMRLLTTRQTLLTGDVKIVAAPNVMQIVPSQMMDRGYSDRLAQGHPTVAMRR